jgi:hypothetical protein
VQAGLRIGLPGDVDAAALIEPGLELIGFRKAERNRPGEGEHRDLARLIGVVGFHELERPAPNRVKGLRSPHDLSGGEQIELESTASEFSHPRDKSLLEFLRHGAWVPERLHPPGNGGLRMHIGCAQNARSGARSGDGAKRCASAAVGMVLIGHGVSSFWCCHATAYAVGFEKSIGFTSTRTLHIQQQQSHHICRDRPPRRPHRA